MTRRTFGRRLVAGVMALATGAWLRPRGLGKHIAVYKHAFRPRDYMGEWKFVVFHRREP